MEAFALPVTSGSWAVIQILPACKGTLAKEMCAVSYFFFNELRSSAEESKQLFSTYSICYRVCYVPFPVIDKE